MIVVFIGAYEQVMLRGSWADLISIEISSSDFVHRDYRERPFEGRIKHCGFYHCYF
jgi:hypothetical protein